ncbi:hypothetical protein SY83_03610 [Paenibacillus swuensis]|uniref:Uncharacterized protein n=1 Tax=Paenibacillus swuensis TaxID=1178515 RepID=A0A172TF35_9BACL|nr:hypothetical protein [Paenibacillus swuensis]ANE45546.1 hypothetical protein SY83_03610 [Paenibacillus swuensis]
MKKKLLIKHVTGRMLFNTLSAGVSFDVEMAVEGWIFTVQQVPADVADLVRGYKDELNLFYMEEENGVQYNKCWYYGRRTPDVRYDKADQVLTIGVDSRKAYTNEKV